ncbi:unnamed protein product [Symbiodinium sp. CCMP2592]|nr:unnamed protein product [Symbiodinium sp. CCMP2592]
MPLSDYLHQMETTDKTQNYLNQRKLPGHARWQWQQIGHLARPHAEIPGRHAGLLRRPKTKSIEFVLLPGADDAAPPARDAEVLGDHIGWPQELVGAAGVGCWSSEGVDGKFVSALETGVESMAAKGRGGARHTPKPFTDEGVLLKVLGDHKDLIKDLGPYELISRSGAVDPKGLVRNLDLLRDLLRAEPTGELMRDDPTVNTSSFNGSVWSNLKGERLGCLLNHTRKWARAEVEGKSNAASKLTAFEYRKLKELLDLFQDKEVPETGPRLALEDRKPPSKEGRQLRPKPSLDSDGFPKMFGESQASSFESADEALSKGRAPCSVSFLKRRAGQSLMVGQEEPEEEAADALKEAMGGGGTEPKEQPLKKPAASQPIPGHVGGWKAVRKTKASKPARCYLTGTLGPAGKRLLITEVPERWTSQYEKVIDIIKKALEKDPKMTKDQAQAMRTSLCKKYP